MYTFCLHKLILILLVCFAGGSIHAQQISIDRDSSELWIAGSSNVNDFNCNVEEYDSHVSPPAEEEDQMEVEVDIVVDSFECGKKRMNRDLYETLQGGKHPTINFIYQSTEEMTYNDHEELYHLTIRGNLTVAGHSKEIQLQMQVQLFDDGTIEVRGSTDLNMTDYNIEPPTALFGLVKVDNTLTVHFKLKASSPDLTN